VASSCRACQTDARRLHSQKDLSRGTAASVLAEVKRQRLSNIGEQGQAVQQTALTANDNLSSPPVEVIELEADDLSRPKAKSGEEKQDRVVASAARCRPIRGAEDTFHLLGGEDGGY
jgi:hypothetical protein